MTDSKTEEVLKSFTIYGNSEKVIQTIDSLSVMIRNYLIVSKIGKGESLVANSSWPIYTNSPEAFKYLLYGHAVYEMGDIVPAKYWFLKSINIDSTFFLAAYELWATYWALGQYDSSKYWCLKLYKIRDHLNQIYQKRVDYTYSKCFGTDFEAIRYLIQLTDLDEPDANDLYTLGINYNVTFQYKKAITVLEGVLEIYDEWNSRLPGVGTYIQLGKAYHETGQYKKEKKLYKKAEHDFPESPRIVRRQAILALTEKDTVSANRYIEKYIFTGRVNPPSEVVIAATLYLIYYEAGILDKAEKYIRQALSLAPDNHGFINALAWCLIEKDRNVNEGLVLSDKSLKLSPDNYEYLDTKGWGLYKLGRYMEALEVLQRSWDLRRKEAVYVHGAFLHLEAAQKAVAEQKSN